MNAQAQNNPIDHDERIKAFEEFYEKNLNILNGARGTYIALINSLLQGIDNNDLQISKIEGRVKDKKECIKKFNRKYKELVDETGQSDYKLEEYITDLIGLRVVCLYEDQATLIAQILKEHFGLIDQTDKTAQLEKTDNSFGYKGIHLDLKLNDSRISLPEYKDYQDLRFEVQIRSIIQDSWSVLDHKIKYKKSIPDPLKRRINRLAALFEIADNEFRQIRDDTDKQIEVALSPDNSLTKTDSGTEESKEINTINVFNVLKIAQHFFKTYYFEPHRIDGFTQEIIAIDPNVTPQEFNNCIRDHLSCIKDFIRDRNLILTPWTIMRHCLYKSDKQKFKSVLWLAQRVAFDEYLTSKGI